MAHEENTGAAHVSMEQYDSLLSLTNWMEFFGFFYYVVCGMFAFGSVLVLIMGVISSGAHTVMLIMMSLVFLVYSILSIYLGIDLFKTSANFRKSRENGLIDKIYLIRGFEGLKRFFWYYGALILLNLIWLAFL